MVKIKNKSDRSTVIESDAVIASIPVFFNGDEIGEVIRLKAKEIGGYDHMELILKLGHSSEMEGLILEVIKKQGIQLGVNKQLET